MVRDALKGYLALASGMTEVTRQRALATAKQLVAQGEATAEQVQNIAEDLVTTSRNNRDALVTLVRYEIDRALGRMGLATAEEVSTLQRRVRRLEGELREAHAAPAKKTAAKKTAAKKTAAKKSAAKKTAAKKTAAKKTAAKKTAAKKS